MYTSIRKCPECGKDIVSKTKSKHYFNVLEKHKHKKTTLCRSCCQSGEKNHMFGKSKELNHFYGKKHSIESKKKMSDSLKGHVPWNKGKTGTQSGTKNGMFGKSVLDIWIEKFGKEEAEKRWKVVQEYKSKIQSGENNPMYGKPAPRYSGNGWKGWYKGWFFRSLRELSYMINVIERFGMDWKSAELKEYKILYKNEKGNNRTYSADFIINDKYLVEIKPKKLMNSPKNRAKTESAIKWCGEHNMIYKIVDPIIDKNKILNKYHHIKWLNKQYEQKFLNY